MSFERKQLAQLRPSDTNAASLVSPARLHTLEVETVVVCNTTGSAVTFRLFHDDDGTTYDQSTALQYDAALPANSSVSFEVGIEMNNSNGNLAVRSSSGNAITFTAYGKDHDAISFED